MSEARHPDKAKRRRVLVVGLGTMGMSHAQAYESIDGFELVGLCTRNASARHDLDREYASSALRPPRRGAGGAEARRGRDLRLY